MLHLSNSRPLAAWSTFGVKAPSLMITQTLLPGTMVFLSNYLFNFINYGHRFNQNM